jgi:uncharacterized membrane protein
MTIALVLAAMTILDWITVYTAAKLYLVVILIAYIIAVVTSLNERS